MNLKRGHAGSAGVSPNDFSTPVDTSSSNPPSLPEPNVSKALKEITSLLNTVVKRIDRVENELKQQHTTVSSSFASETGKNAKKKSAIPLIVRVS